jgi:2-C-methyl-D-erythritol 4-phosphate cytidylyltransferase
MGTRFRAPIPKQFTDIDGKSMIERALHSILESAGLDRVLVMVSPDHEQHLTDVDVAGLSDARVQLAYGGATRGQTIQKAIQWATKNFETDAETRFVVHDACRPFVSSALIEKFLSAPLSKDAWVSYQKPGDAIAIKRPSGEIEVAVASDGVMALNTPIVMSLATAKLVADEPTEAFSRGLAGYLIERGLDVGFIETDGSTRKITFSYDLSET